MAVTIDKCDFVRETTIPLNQNRRSNPLQSIVLQESMQTPGIKEKNRKKRITKSHKIHYIVITFY